VRAGWGAVARLAGSVLVVVLGGLMVAFVWEEYERMRAGGSVERFVLRSVLYLVAAGSLFALAVATHPEIMR
jgi:hypothetical protein